MKPRKGIFYGWWIVLAGGAISFLTGGTAYYGFGPFFNPIRETFGWTAAVTALAISTQGLVSGFAGPVAGIFIDRMGPRAVAVFGATVVGLGFALLPTISSLWTFYLYFLVIAIGLSATGFMVVNTAVANWFVRKRGTAFALAQIGFAASGLVAAVIVFLISSFGWRASLLMVGVSWWAVGIPLSLVLRHKPERYGLLPDGEQVASRGQGDVSKRANENREVQGPELTAFQAMRTASFWLMAGSWCFTLLGLAAVLALLVPVLESYGVSRSTAGFTVFALTVTSMAGRVGFGIASGKADQRVLLAITSALQAAGIMLLALVRAQWMLIPFVVIMSVGFGGDFVLRPTVQARYFGRKAFGALQGYLILATAVAGFVGPVLAGWIFDVSGSYRPVLWSFGLVALASIPMVLALRPLKQGISVQGGAPRDPGMVN